MKKYEQINASLTDFRKIDENFSRANVKVMYVGRNRNGSFFSKESVEKALPSLANMPIVGEFKDGKFGGHGGKMLIDEDGIEFIPTTRPYGLIPESFTYEWIIEDIGSGRQKETLLIKDVILWTEHYKEAINVFLKNLEQSMEIQILEGTWDEDLEIYRIEDFKFLALCILEDTEPAFENSHFYTLSKDEFRKEFNTMMFELSNSLSKESNKEENILPEEPTNPILEPEVEPEIVEPEADPNAEPEPEVETDPIPDPEVDPEIEPEADPEIEPDPEVDPETDPEVDFEARIKELEEELKTYKDAKTTLENQVAELNDFKLKTLKDQHEQESEILFARLKLTSEDVAGIDIHQFTLKELEKECFAVLGRKASEGNFSLSNETNTTINFSTKQKVENEYSDLIEKFGKR